MKCKSRRLNKKTHEIENLPRQQETFDQSNTIIEPNQIQDNNEAKLELGGLILANKHLKTLDTLLKAYKERIKFIITLKERWRKYLDLECEARQLDIYKCLVEAWKELNPSCLKKW